jgi:hypothetical protein
MATDGTRAVDGGMRAAGGGARAGQRHARATAAEVRGGGGAREREERSERVCDRKEVGFRYVQYICRVPAIWHSTKIFLILKYTLPNVLG